jgi:hypothetical protein
MDLLLLIHKGFDQINETKWLKSCDNVKNIIEQTYWTNDTIQDEIQNFIINIESDSESDSDNDISSDCDETEDYHGLSIKLDVSNCCLYFFLKQKGQYYF